MGATNKHKSGFSTVEAVLALVVIVLIGSVGWLVYRKTMTDMQPVGQSSKQSTSAQTSARSSGVNSPDSAKKYFDIDTWNVRMPYINGDDDAYLASGINPGPASRPQLQSIFIISAKLKQYTGCQYQGAGIITRSPNASDVTDLDHVGGPKLINGYYYVYNPESDTCGASGKTVEAQVNAVTQQMFGSLEAAPAGYLYIDEWGIKIKMEDADKVTYTIGGTPNSSSSNADGIISWATLKLSNSITTDSRCQSLGFEIEQLAAATNAAKVGTHYYGFSGAYATCGDSILDPLRTKIDSTELTVSVIKPE